MPIPKKDIQNKNQKLSNQANEIVTLIFDNIKTKLVSEPNGSPNRKEVLFFPNGIGHIEIKVDIEKPEVTIVISESTPKKSEA